MQERFIITPDFILVVIKVLSITYNNTIDIQYLQ